MKLATLVTLSIVALSAVALAQDGAAQHYYLRHAERTDAAAASDDAFAYVPTLEEALEYRDTDFLARVLKEMDGEAYTPAFEWMDTRLTPEERADLIIKNMTFSEKFHFLHGHPLSGLYAGVVPPLKRLKTPALHLEDGPQGVADQQRLVTCFPSAQTVAASFDRGLLYSFAKAIAVEEKKKGVNVVLAPMINMARVPRAGRNFESMGEDPFLSGELAYAYIKGIQDQGLIAVAKHWAMNNQEKNRTRTSANGAQRTFFEMYVPHFRRAVEAGVGSVMCSYNRVNDTHACQNDYILNTVLKGQFGFQGWVMSDWQATHSASVAANAGLDQEMPLWLYFGVRLQIETYYNKTSIARIDDMNRRIFTQMFRAGIFDRPAQGGPFDNATSPEHAYLSRYLSTQGTVLAKNDASALPVRVGQYKVIGIVGDQASVEPIFRGGGSGNVQGPYVVTPLEAFQARFGATATIEYANTTDLKRVQEIAQRADVVFAFVGTRSGEGGDRATLALPPAQNLLIETVAEFVTTAKVIVVCDVPGATLMPWADDVDAVLIPFFSGQEDGNAAVDVITGDINPSARLPVTFPATEQGTPVHLEEQYPGIDNNAEYIEALQIGYRWYDAQHVDPLFPFGHGLSYTEFTYSGLSISGQGHNITITFKVQNTGKYDGAEVSQLYVGFPSYLNEPPKQLKGFEKFFLPRGGSQTVTITLNARSFEWWNTAKQSYQSDFGQYTFMVGKSSRNIVLQ